MLHIILRHAKEKYWEFISFFNRNKNKTFILIVYGFKYKKSLFHVFIFAVLYFLIICLHIYIAHKFYMNFNLNFANLLVFFCDF